MRPKKVTTFEITAEHLKLFRHMNVWWDDTEYGAPAIDPKRPYGNSDVEEDILEILGCAKDPDYDDWGRSARAYAAKLHREMETALHICLVVGAFEAGTYCKRDSIRNRSWEKLQ